MVDMIETPQNDQIETCNTCLEDYIESPIIYKAVKTLTKKQKIILHYAYIKQYKVVEIAKLLGLSQQAVSKARKDAITRLRKACLKQKSA